MDLLTRHRRVRQGMAIASLRGGMMGKPIAVNQYSSPKEESLGSPYLVARREWDERYGGFIKRAQQGRGTAGFALFVALSEAIVVFWVGTRPRKSPYLVGVGSLGRGGAAGAINRRSPLYE